MVEVDLAFGAIGVPAIMREKSSRRHRARSGSRVFAAAKPLFVAVVFFLVEAHGRPAAAAHRAPPAALEAAAVGRLFLRPEDPFVDVAIEIVDAEGRHALGQAPGGEALIELLELGLALGPLHARLVLEELL